MDKKRELLLQLLENINKEKPKKQKDIAIIGVSGRYPKSPNLDIFWENLSQGKNCISEMPADRWNSDDYSDICYSKWGGFIEDVDKFDPLFFHISPREAEAMDPQERLFLEIAWEVFEDAGYTRNTFAEVNNRVGVFAGVMNCNYEWLSGYAYAKGYRSESRCAYWSIANRLSYVFNFQGPSFAVDSACSSSLTALHLACESLNRGECEVALSGGVNLILSPIQYQRLCNLNMITPGDQCKSFGLDADGFVDGEGVGAVLLKPLEQAIADKDRIYAVIKGTAVNAGGKTSGYTVPNPNAQSEVIVTALEKSEIDPRTISYIEAHGTGTSLGDPIEITGLNHAFRQYTQENQYCAIGSSKSNIGHLESAAGIAAITKVILQMQHKQLVPTLNCDQLNPKIDFSNSPFIVQRELQHWKKPVIKNMVDVKEYPRRAAVSSFGAGGANAHVIIEENPATDSNTTNQSDLSLSINNPSHTNQLILLSAKNRERLQAYANKIIELLEKKGNKLNLEEMAYTLQFGREAMDERLAVVVSSIEQLKEILTEYTQANIANGAFTHNNFFTGNDKDNSENPNETNLDKNRNERIRELLIKRDLTQLAQVWVTQANNNELLFDWKLLYPGTNPKLISLPTYPFIKNHYWIGGIQKPSLLFTQPAQEKDKKQDLPTRNIENELPIFKYKQDNMKQKLLSGMVYIEMVRNKLENNGDLTLNSIRNVAWAEPLSLNGNLPELEIELYPNTEINPQSNLREETCEREFEVSIKIQEEQQSYRHLLAQGQVQILRSAQIKSPINNARDRMPIGALMKQCPNIINTNECYRRLDAAGMEIPLQMQIIEIHYSSQEEMLTQLNLSKIETEERSSIKPYPMILEGIVQSLNIFLNSDQEKAYYFPYRLERLEQLDAIPTTTPFFMHAIPVEKHNPEIGNNLQKTFDIKLADQNGRLLLKMDGYSIRQW